MLFRSYITWGGDQPATTDWSTECVEEAWVIITEEDAHLVDLPALRADILALGGHENAA